MGQEREVEGRVMWTLHQRIRQRMCARSFRWLNIFIMRLTIDLNAFSDWRSFRTTHEQEAERKAETAKLSARSSCAGKTRRKTVKPIANETNFSLTRYGISTHQTLHN